MATMSFGEAGADIRKMIEDNADEAASSARANAMRSHLDALGFDSSGLELDVDDKTVTVSGAVDDRNTKERIVLSLGNVSGITTVVDNIEVDDSTPESTFHTVVKGDTLWKIADAAYGDGSKYPSIFEANKPMLKSADLIYPGQVLRIPPLEG